MKDLDIVTSAMDSGGAQVRVLTLGDGDFSFSLALATLLQMRHVRANVVCSSYDTREEVCAKHEGAGSTLQRLERWSDGLTEVEVWHRVDATALHRLPPLAPWDVIVFNFPHLGEENAQLHACFMAHILYSCADQSVLATGGVVYITLADEQVGRCIACAVH
jgi:hypothetical protein